MFLKLTTKICYNFLIELIVSMIKNRAKDANILFLKINYNIFLIQVNVFTVVALTVERYTCLKEKTLNSNDRAKMRIIIVYIVLLWILAIFFSLPKTMSIIEVNYNETIECESTFEPEYDQIYTIAKWIIAFVMPYLIIIFFSILLLIFLKKWSNKSKLLHGAGSNAKKNVINNRNKSCDSNAENKSIEEKSSEIKNLIAVKLVASNLETSHETKVINSDTNLLLNTLPMNQLKNNQNQANRNGNKVNRVKPNRTTMIKRRTTRFVLAVVISFLCCWSPLWIFQIVVMFTESKSIILQLMRQITLIINYLGGVINPLLFLILTENFRDFIAQRLRKTFRHN